MRISVVKETAEFEKRVALTPDMVKRYAMLIMRLLLKKVLAKLLAFQIMTTKYLGRKLAKHLQIPLREPRLF